MGDRKSSSEGLGVAAHGGIAVGGTGWRPGLAMKVNAKKDVWKDS